MKGERNAQVYQVGPYLFGTSSTIPHWKTEELIPSPETFPVIFRYIQKKRTQNSILTCRPAGE